MGRPRHAGPSRTPPPTPPPEVMRRLSASLLMVALGSCGGEDPVDRPSAAQQSVEATRPIAPARLYPDTLAPSRQAWNDLRPRLDPGPAGDAWATEAVALRAEEALRLVVQEVLAGRSSGLEGMTGRGFVGTRGLAPSEWSEASEQGGLRLRTARVTESAARDQVPAGFEALLAPLVGRPAEAEVHCTAVDEREQSLFGTRLDVRVSGTTADGLRLQRRLSLDLVWRVARKFLLQDIEGASIEEALELAPTFVEATEGLLAGTRLEGLENLEGAVEHTRRMDIQVAASAVALGMHGIGVGDLNGDGLEDLYIGRHAGEPNHYLLRTAEGGFVDAPPGHGADLLEDTCGVLVCDLDGDGSRDLALAVFEKVVVLWNDGSGRFPASTILESDGGAQVYTLVAGDADGDGDLDLYDTRYHRGDHEASPPLPYHDARNGAANHLWANDGDRSFHDATLELGLDEGNDRYSLAALWHDLDQDGDLDLYVTNDFGRNNDYRFEAGRFQDAAARTGALDMAAGMGVSVADVDRDGFDDLYISNMWSAAGARVTQHPRFMQRHPEGVRAMYGHHAAGNTLLLGLPDGGFRDGSLDAGLSPGGWSWGSILFDWDNDGYADAFVPNGFTTMWTGREAASYFWRVVVESSPATAPLPIEYQRNWQFLTHLGQVEGWSLAGSEGNRAYANRGGVFHDVSGAVGLGHVEDGRSAVTLDLDGDGRLELITKNRTAPLVRAFHNRTPEAGAWISIELSGKAPNTEAIGAVVTVRSGGLEQRRTVHAGEGYLASPSKRLHFGLGSGKVEEVRVRWPGGEERSYGVLAAGRGWRISPEGTDQEAPRTAPLPAAGSPLAVGMRGFRSRMPLLVTLPLAGWRLPRFEGVARLTGEGDGPLAVVAWAGWDDPSRELLADLGEQAGRLAAVGAEVHPLSMDEPRDEAWVRADVAKTGLPEHGGRADTRTRELLDVLVGLTAGQYESLELPLVYLFDRTGRLAVLHLGPEASAEAILADLEAIGDRDLGRVPTSLSGGKWLTLDPRRSKLEAIASYLEANGERALAKSLRSDG